MPSVFNPISNNMDVLALISEFSKKQVFTYALTLLILSLTEIVLLKFLVSLHSSHQPDIPLARNHSSFSIEQILMSHS